ncbi:hypothetical protein HPB48_006310 [Haemaphysalis longicornis]|uniref:CXC MSL2-type domain-containing protein n=1 Tax=Haemaphysalis longicornis TaxID=44386 RepID=A0A9J6G6A6_HAELO|nr:hypothetical protein HPB48_006310 [Haemaphysalis longicornis]
MPRSAPCVDCNNTTAGYTEGREQPVERVGYKTVCHYLDPSKCVMTWDLVDGGTNLTLTNMVVEGSWLADEYLLVEPTSTNLSSTSSAVPSLGASPSRSPSLAPVSKPPPATTVPTRAARVVNQTSAVAPITKTVDGTRRAPIRIGDERADSAPYKLTKIPEVVDLAGGPPPSAAPVASLLHYSRHKTKTSAFRGCKCGATRPNPGQTLSPLTCCGQRCPCYAAFRSCINCRCKGCRNPIDVSAEVNMRESVSSGVGGPPQVVHIWHIRQVDD